MKFKNLNIEDTFKLSVGYDAYDAPVFQKRALDYNPHTGSFVNALRTSDGRGFYIWDNDEVYEYKED